ncbi:DUF6017 domain-containing protein [Dielma fastidiosa]|uniref:DUF6017 domain-containing protein n=1 Tax=Dielma fastidiosa TaxID=1034346 RepID=UPI0035694BBB
MKSRFMKLDCFHIQYMLSSMQDNATYIRNIKKYLLAALYNARVTISKYHTSLVNHDLYEMYTNFKFKLFLKYNA